MTTQPTRPPTAQEFVLGELRRGIVSGAMRPGEQIRQDALAERLGTSRVPLREALKILEGEGQVEYHPHRGYFVASLSSADLIEVYRIRTILEDEAIAVAVPLVTDADLERMESLLLDIETAGEAGDITGMTAANRAFHFSLFDGAGMPRLVRLIRQLWDSTDAYRAVYFSEKQNREQVRAEHRAMLAAIARRDVAGVIQCMNEHREHAVRRVSTVLDGAQVHD